jgi:hypothetical protein
MFNESQAKLSKLKLFKCLDNYPFDFRVLGFELLFNIRIKINPELKSNMAFIVQERFI